MVAATDEPRRERSATTLTPQWYGPAEALQRRADSKPLVSYSQELGRRSLRIDAVVGKCKGESATFQPISELLCPLQADFSEWFD